MQWLPLPGILDKGEKATKDVTRTAGEICLWTILYIYINVVDFINDKLLKNDSSMVFLVLRRFI